MKRLASHLTEYIKNQNSDLTEIEVLKVQFGLECLLNDFSKVIIFLIISLIFGYACNFLLLMSTFFIMRYFAGGYHSDTYIKCFILSLTMSCMIIFLGITFPLSNIFIILLSAICIILIYIYAPADHPNKPIISEQHRIRKKYSSIVAFIFICLIAFLFDITFRSTIIYALVFECISLPFVKFCRPLVTNE